MRRSHSRAVCLLMVLVVLFPPMNPVQRQYEPCRRGGLPLQAQMGFPHRLVAVDTLPGKTGHSKAMYRFIILMY